MTVAASRGQEEEGGKGNQLESSPLRTNAVTNEDVDALVASSAELYESKHQQRAQESGMSKGSGHQQSLYALPSTQTEPQQQLENSRRHDLKRGVAVEVEKLSP
jgi:hypothetical protein